MDSKKNISCQSIKSLYRMPFKKLIAEAQSLHGKFFPEDEIQLSTLLSIKTGGCPENCSYCPQSAHYSTGLERQSLLPLKEVLRVAKGAKEKGSTRFCMGAAWREVRDGEEFDSVLTMVREVKALGLEVCCTLGMLSADQAMKLKEAGLYAYNHNIDSSEGFYSKIVSTRNFRDRLRTIENVRKAGLTVCTGGIIGMGESEQDRIDFIYQLAQMSPQPESVTVNALIPIRGTPLEKRTPPTSLELARVIATIRCLIPSAMIRLSAGRKAMSDEGQALCFLAGANSIFLGETLLTSANPTIESDRLLMKKMGLEPAPLSVSQ